MKITIYSGAHKPEASFKLSIIMMEAHISICYMLYFSIYLPHPIPSTPAIYYISWQVQPDPLLRLGQFKHWKCDDKIIDVKTNFHMKNACTHFKVFKVIFSAFLFQPT